jgi:hypothetical protein
MIDRAAPGLLYSPRDQTARSAHVGNGHLCWNLLIGQIWVR